MSEPLSIKALCQDCFELAGELTRDTVPELWQQRHNICCGDDQVVISLGQLGRVDSAGLAFLVALRAAARLRAGAFAAGAADTVAAVWGVDRDLGIGWFIRLYKFIEHSYKPQSI